MRKFRVVFEVEKIIEANDEFEASEVFFSELMEELADADYTIADLDIEEVKQ